MLLLVEGSTGGERKEFLGGEGQKEFAPEEMEHIQVCFLVGHVKRSLVSSEHLEFWIEQMLWPHQERERTELGFLPFRRGGDPIT